MSRPFIRERDFVKNLEAGQLEATCISCDGCSGRGVFSKMMLMCHQE
jgi:2,4-dienoyl-CoA reductase-like NADH-dependent reductase (Old Yellow Enzyme family)